eukprot:CAMPEP_0113554676 /NCGR_PEP_ID=MMETSP0015_2-20120614/16286_1 /TAXON_ID=2838 /ORGANISM="Odontella" /LENGTH=88 /DNA_ID=CAMNT_0000455853 /DNA_START=789 /DNA_END=1052 /DNA_ORIENTATION=- /assembly_acc=CAM_ASM_000160
MKDANLVPERNLWFGVYDFNDEARTGKNWRIVDPNAEGPLWAPLGNAENCCPRVEPGSISLPSEQSGGAGSENIPIARKEGCNETAPR